MKKSPIKLSSKQQQKPQQKSTSRGKQKPLQKSNPKQPTQPSTTISPSRHSQRLRTPPPPPLTKSPSRHPNPKTPTLAPQPQHPTHLSSIPQSPQPATKPPHNRKSSVTFITNQQLTITKPPQKPTHQHNENDDNRSPSFQRSSMLRSEKRYNVSLASMSSFKQHSATPVPRSRSQSKKSLLLKEQRDSREPITPTRARTSFETDEEIQQWLAINLAKVANQSIKSISQEYKQLIEQPLRFQQELSKSGSGLTHPQRCLQHNTPYSLYCTIDRQLLCVSCIYTQKSLHRTHTITPLPSSLKQITQDSDSFKNRIDSTLSQSEALIRQSSLNLIKIQKEYPILLQKINEYYTRIHDMIEEKKQEQVEYVNGLKQEYKTEMKVVSGLLGMVNNVLVERVKEVEREQRLVQKVVYRERMMMGVGVGQQQQQSNSLDPSTPTTISQTLLHSTIKTRCTYQILARYHKILHKHSDQLFDQKKSFDLKLQNFQQVVSLIRYKLAMVVPVMKGEEKKPWIGELVGEEGGDKGGEKAKGKGEKRGGKVLGGAGEGEGREGEKEAVIDNKGAEDKSLKQKKGFSTSPQVPKGLSRRFL